MTDRPRSKINYDTFHEWKGYCSGETAVLLCTGPSLKDYSPNVIPDPFNTFHVGVNEAVFHYHITLDYLFLQDTKPTHEYGHAKRPDPYNHYPCTKFAGKAPYIPTVHTIPWADIKEFGWKPYAIGREGLCEFQTDIDTYCLGDGNSVAFSAAQWALFTGISTLYLVGVDIIPRGNILGEPAGDFHPYKHWDHLGKWKIFKEWAATAYPETEIISINPIGLKGVFTDLYQ